MVKAGDIVRISTASIFYSKVDDPSNPKCNGTVLSINRSVNIDCDDLPILVQWSNGCENIYDFGDLVTIGGDFERRYEKEVL